MLRWTARLCQSQQRRLDAAGIRYVASDMDGTVLGADHTLSDFTKRTLFALTQERNIPFIFATGRMYADVAAVNDHLQAFFRSARAEKQMREDAIRTTTAPTPVFLITCNGAVAHNAHTGEVVMQECIPEPLVRELYALLPASETRINTHLSQRDRWYSRMDWAEMLQFHKESGLAFTVVEKFPQSVEEERRTCNGIAENKQGHSNSASSGGGVRSEVVDATKVVPGAAAGDASGVVKVFFTSWDKPLLDKLELLLQQRYGDELTVIYSASYCVDVTTKSATKAKALERVLSLLPPELRASSAHPLTSAQEAQVAQRMAQTISFGNDLNDACMLRATGQGFLMANSNPRLLESCAGMEVVGDHAEDGVAKKLCEVFDLKVPASKSSDSGREA